MATLVCKCGKGHASIADNMCKYCREKLFSRAENKRAGVRYSGDGLRLDQLERIINSSTKRTIYENSIRKN